MVIALTGHRPGRLHNHEAEVAKWLSDVYALYNPDKVISGMAQGVDQIGATQAILAGIPLICVYPFEKNYYHPVEEEIMEKAEEVIHLFSDYSIHKNKSYWLRDKYMVDHCDMLVAVWDEIQEGGTWLTIKYAKEQGKKIIYYPFPLD